MYDLTCAIRLAKENKKLYDHTKPASIDIGKIWATDEPTQGVPTSARTQVQGVPISTDIPPGNTSAQTQVQGVPVPTYTQSHVNTSASTSAGVYSVIIQEGYVYNPSANINEEIETAIANGIPYNVGSNVGTIDTRQVWAAECLPRGTVFAYMKGKKVYAYDLPIENVLYKFAIVVNGNDVNIHVRQPDTSTHIKTAKDMHNFHCYSQGRICASHHDIKSAYATGVVWAAAYNYYLKTGSSDKFRIFDSKKT